MEKLKEHILDLKKELAEGYPNICDMREKVRSAVREKKRLMEINAELKKQILVEKPASLTQGVTSVINGLVRKYYSRYGESRVGREIIAGIWNKKICGGAATKCATIKVVKKYYQDNIFTPEKILRAMDIAGGTCNLKALTILRDVEVCTNDPFKDTSRKRCDAILPHEWRV